MTIGNPTGNGAASRRITKLAETYGKLDDSVNQLAETLKKLTRVVDSVDLNSLIQKSEELRKTTEQANKIQKIVNESKKETIALDDKTQRMFQRMLTQQSNFIRIQQEATKTQKELTAAKKEDEKAIDPNEWSKRSEILSRTIKILQKENKKFEATNRETFRIYKEQGGNLADYIAEFILGTREEITLLGVEAGKFRKILYGFAPPGTFRVFNKIASPLQIIGGVLRNIDSSAKDATESYGNLLTTMVKFGRKGVGLFKVDARASRLEQESKRGGKVSKMRATIFNRFRDIGKFDSKAIKGAREDAKTVKKFLEERGNRARYRNTKNMNKVISTRNFFAKGLNKIPKVNLAMKDKKEFKNKMGKDEFKKLKEEFKKVRTDLRNYSIKKFFGKVGNAIKKLLPMVLSGFMKFFLVFSFVMIGIWVLVKKFGPVLKEAFTSFQTIFAEVWKGLKISFAPLIKGFKLITESFKKGGTFEQLIDGLLLFGLGILTSAIGVLLTVLSAALILLGAVVVKSIQSLWKGIQESFKSAKGTLNLLLTGISLIVAGVVFFISGAWIAVLVGALVYWLGRKVGKVLGFFADGGTVNTPMQIVGEEGPELVTLPKGAQVTNAKKTSQIMGNKSYNTNNTFNITVNAKDTSDAELRRIAQKIGNMVNTNINRSVSSRTLG